mmetsp:Transcript_13742/g.23590  ORF Transcript_13742/g.23590 Transcript_13742/m.23590 type:complete len:92 (-) Transcript_13742:152-427(-)
MGWTLEIVVLAFAANYPSTSHPSIARSTNCISRHLQQSTSAPATAEVGDYENTSKTALDSQLRRICCPKPVDPKLRIPGEEPSPRRSQDRS